MGRLDQEQAINREPTHGKPRTQYNRNAARNDKSANSNPAFKYASLEAQEFLD